MITVITRTLFPQNLWSEMESLTDRSIPVFEAQPGFISMNILKAKDDSGTLTLFKWASLGDHENCLKSPDWGELNHEWEVFMGRKDVHFEFVFIGESWKGKE